MASYSLTDANENLFDIDVQVVGAVGADPTTTQTPRLVQDVFGINTGVNSAEVSNITRGSLENIGSGSTASWVVTFNGNVGGVSSANFTLVQGGGLSGASITNVIGSGTTYTVTSTTGSSAGTLQLDLENNTGITPTVSNTPFSGQSYNVLTGTFLQLVNIQSNNTNPTTAVSGDVITLTFTSSAEITNVNVTILGQTATVDDLGDANPSTWQATYTVQSSDPSGTATFEINFEDGESVAQTPVTATTNSTFVTVSGSASPEINVLGNSASISSGSTTTSTTNNTDYGTVTIGSPTSRAFVVSNTGSSDLSVTNITSSNSAFTIDQSSFTVASSGSTTINITYSPNEASTQQSTITITNNDADENPYTFVVQGTGVAATAPEIAVLGEGNTEIANGSTAVSTSNGTDLETTDIGSSFTRTFSISNTGTASLSVDTIISSNSLFVISSDINTVASGATGVFNVVFTPDSAKTETATITITNNDSDESSYTFQVQGTGRQPPGQVKLSTESIAGSALLQGRQDVMIYKMVWEVTANSVTNSGFFIELDGTYAQSDFESIELLFGIDVDNINAAESQGTGSFNPSPSVAPETSYGWLFERSFTAGQVIYVYLVADIQLAASTGITFNVRQPASTNFGFGDAVIDASFAAGPVFSIVEANTAQDSLALVSFYNATNSSQNWIDSTGWLTDELANWFGVTVSNSRVTAIDLPQNGLSGEVPTDLSTMSELNSVDVSDNELTLIPQLSTISTLTSLNVSGNNLQFGSIEPNVSITTFQYQNQGLIGTLQTSPTLIRIGGDFVLRLPVSGARNRYSWSRVNANGEQEVSTTPTVSITGISFDNMGEFTLVITSDSITDLTLESHPQEVFATAILNGTVTGVGGTGLDAGTMDALFIPFDDGRYDSLDQVSVVNGAFSFGELILGDYACVTRGDSTIYLPTYFGNTDLWIESDTILLRNDLTLGDYTMQAIPAELPNLPGGGVIGLGVESDFANERSKESARIEARRKLQKVGCSLRRRRRATGGRPQNDEFELVVYKETDANGEVTFENLPADTYRLNIEYPGIPMDPNSFIEFEVGEAGSDNNELTLAATVDEDGIAVELVEELGFYQPEYDNMRVYPNPAVQEVTVRFDRVYERDLLVIITDLSGKALMQQRLLVEDNTASIDLSQIQEGLFLMQIVGEGRTKREAYRLIIRR